jgi:hypothetical protein
LIWSVHAISTRNFRKLPGARFIGVNFRPGDAGRPEGRGRGEIGRDHGAWPRGEAPGAARLRRDFGFALDIFEQRVAIGVRGVDHDARSIAAGEAAAAGAKVVATTKNGR